MQTLTLIRGLPGSGKSTLAKALGADNNSINFEADMYFMKNGQYVFDQSKLHSAHQWCFRQTDEYLGHNMSVIVSNTFTTQKECQPYIDLAKEKGIKLQIITVQGEFGSIHNVPEAAIERMKARFQWEIKV
jgi:predicted kinase